MLQAEQFELERIAAHGYRLRWQPQSSQFIAAIAAGSAPDALTAQAIIDNVRGSAEFSDLEPAARHFFRVQFFDGSELLLAERRLALHGTPNFRDFGGYTADDGRRVRWGQLYRSGHLSQLSDNDLQVIAALDIGLVCDFRHASERERAPNRYALEHCPRIEHLPIIPGSAADVFSQLSTMENSVRAEAMAQLMIDINRDLALHQQEAYKKLFRLLVENDSAILIHCAAGKDRTGFGAALILAALGVPEATLLRDYLLTDKYLPIERELHNVRKKYRLDLPDDVLRPMLEVRHEYLRGALDAIHQEFGSLENYLRDALAVDAAMQRELRAKLLAD